MAKSKVSISHQTEIKKGIFEALDSLGDLSDILKGKHVAIKPNETWASPEDLTACTQADTVEAVIQYVKRFRPSRITVSGGSGAAETDEVFKLLGIDKVIEKEEVDFFDHNRPPFQKMKLYYGPQESVMVNPQILKYDTLISLANHKVHNQTGVTLTMKNIAMSFPAADYYGHPRETQKHPHNFKKNIHEFIVGMCQTFPIDLGIIAGHPAMIGRGPIGGKTFESGLVIAGRDFVAVDKVGSSILGFEYIEHVAKAGEIGLGKASLKDIKTVGISLKKAKKIFEKAWQSS